MKPISLVVIDNDGCLVLDQYTNYDLAFVEKMRAFAREAEKGPGNPVPLFTFITGRPQPFVECMQKMFEISLPAIFENGAGMDLGGQSRVAVHPNISEDAVDGLLDARRILRRTVMKEIPSFFQPGKDLSITIIPHDPADKPRLFDLSNEVCEREGLNFEVMIAMRAVDFMLPGTNKGDGLEWLAEHMGHPLDQVAGIGDTSGDVAFLTRCAFGAAPANAVDPVKQAADYVSPHEAQAGVLDILDKIIARNNELVASG
jgi:hydroxymethylpyrimidine pyrophosphatase-like HAD family hydrolase